MKKLFAIFVIFAFSNIAFAKLDNRPAFDLFFDHIEINDRHDIFSSYIVHFEGCGFSEDNYENFKKIEILIDAYSDTNLPSNRHNGERILTFKHDPKITGKYSPNAINIDTENSFFMNTCKVKVEEGFLSDADSISLTDCITSLSKNPAQNECTFKYTNTEEGDVTFYFTFRKNKNI